jgi:hypothetical protein
MAKISSVNQSTATNGGAAALWNLITTLVAAGWTKVRDSDGTTYSASGTQVTGPAAGTNGLNNARAWFVMQQPGGGRQFCFQRATAGTDYQWRVKYSYSAGFSGGSPAATVTPSATDEVVLLGGGTDASPSFGSMFASSPGTYRAHCIAQDAAVSGVYAFYCFCTPNAGGSPNGGIWLEPLAAGSFPAADTDPCIVGGCTTSPFGTTAANYRAWYMKGTGSEAFVDMGLVVPYQSVSAAGGSTQLMGTNSASLVGVNPYDSEDNAMPAMFARQGVASQPGWKGFASALKIKGVLRNYPDTANLATDAYVYVDNCLVPWPDGVTPL